MTASEAICLVCAVGVDHVVSACGSVVTWCVDRGVSERVARQVEYYVTHMMR